MTPAPVWMRLLLFAAVGVLYVIAGAAADPWKARHDAAWTVGQGLAVVTVLVCAFASGRPLGAALQLRRPPRAARAHLPVWTLSTIVAYAAFSVACILVWPGVGGADDPYAGLSQAIFAHPWAFLLPVGVLAPLGEELLFRGFGLTLLGAGGARTLAIVGTTAAFALAHVEPYKILPTAFLGIVLARGAWAMRSVQPGIVVHVAVNAGVVLLAAGIAQGHAEVDTRAALPHGQATIVAAAVWGSVGLLAGRQAWTALRRIEAACADAPGRNDAPGDRQRGREGADGAMVDTSPAVTPGDEGHESAPGED